jgi:hypothetical protein
MIKILIIEFPLSVKIDGILADIMVFDMLENILRLVVFNNSSKG